MLIPVLTCLLFCYGFMAGGQQLVLTTVCEQFGIGVVGMGILVDRLDIRIGFIILSVTAVGAVLAFSLKNHN